MLSTGCFISAHVNKVDETKAKKKNILHKIIYIYIKIIILIDEIF